MRHAVHDLGRVLRIPTLPSVARRLCAIVEDPDVGIREAGAVLAEDPPMTATVLRIANGASYGLRREVGTTEAAATVLGARTLRNLTLQAAILQEYRRLERHSRIDITSIWKHSILCAHVAKRVVQKSGREDCAPADEIYTCGLLHDIGKIVLIDSLRLRYVRILEESVKRQVPSWRVEPKILGYSHMDAGAHVIEQWELPDVIVASARFHHHPAQAGQHEATASAVSLADDLAHLALAPTGMPADLPASSLCRTLQITPEGWEELTAYAAQAARSVEL